MKFIKYNLKLMKYSLPVIFLRERKRIVAYTPALDLATSGKTVAEAQKRFAEASRIFLQEINEKGTLDDVLSSLGWQKIKKEWNPPTFVKSSYQNIAVPINF